MKLIVAVNNWGYIGRDGELMWKCKEDMQHFKRMTTNPLFNGKSNMIVGRKTAESLEGINFGKGRVLKVVGNHSSLGNVVKDCLWAEAELRSDTWVIGGSQIYKHLVHLCEEIHISHINNNDKGDTSFEIPADYRGKVFHYHFKEDGRSIDNTKEA